MKTHRRGGVVGLACLLVACGGGGSKDLTVVSDDGSATLYIPKSALPKDVSIDDISIIRDDSLATSASANMAAWSLEPDGLQFLEPVRFEVNGVIPSGRLFLAGHATSDSVESLEATLSPGPEGASEPSVSFQIQHFSALYVGDLTEVGEATAEWTASAADVPVNGTFTATARFFQPPPIVETIYIDLFNNRRIEFRHEPGLWTTECLRMRGHGVSPDEIKLESRDSTADHVDISGSFACKASPQPYNVILDVAGSCFVKATGTKIVFHEGQVESESDEVVRGWVKVGPYAAECVAEGGGGGNTFTDPANDCLTNETGEPSPTCDGDVDMIRLEVDKSMEDLVCIKVYFRGGTPVAMPTMGTERRGCSFLPADRTESLGISCVYNPTTMMWEPSTSWIQSSTPDYELEDPPEGCRIVGDHWEFCVRPSKLPFAIGEFGCSATRDYPDNSQERDKTGNLKFPEDC